MQKKLRLSAGAIAVLALAATGAQAQEKVKIGFVTDLSSLYADLEGKGGATAIQMAIDDFGGKVLGGMVKRIAPDAAPVSVVTMDDIEALAKTL